MIKKVSRFQVPLYIYKNFKFLFYLADYKLFIWGDNINKPTELLIGQYISFNQIFDSKKTQETPIISISLTNYYIIFENRLVCYKKSCLKEYYKVFFLIFFF